MERRAALDSELIQERNINLEQHLEKDKDCKKLTHGDSGHGDSFDENTSPKTLSNETSTSDLTIAKVDGSQSGQNEDMRILDVNWLNPGPPREKVNSTTQTAPDSGIEISPAGNHANFEHFNYERDSPQLFNLIRRQESSNQSNELVSENAMCRRKELKESLEGPVSILSNGDQRAHHYFNGDRSGKHQDNKSYGPLERQYGIDFSLSNADSFFINDPLSETICKGINTTDSLPSPDRSISLSSPLCHRSNPNFAKNGSGNQDAAFGHSNQENHSTTVSNRHIKSHSPSSMCCIPPKLPALLPQAATINSTNNSYVSTSPQRMVPKSLVDNMANELWKVQNKERDIKEKIDAKRRELQAKQSELEAKERELDAKQRELETKQRELEAKERELDAKEQKMQSLTERCEVLENENQGLKKDLWLSEDPEKSEDSGRPADDLQVLGALSLKPENDPDATQIKEAYSSD